MKFYHAFFSKGILLLTVSTFLFINKTLRLNSSKTKTAINAKILVFVMCVESDREFVTMLFA